MKLVRALVFGSVLSTAALLSTTNSAYADQSADQSYNNVAAYEVLEKVAEIRQDIDIARRNRHLQDQCQHLYDLWALLMNFIKSNEAGNTDPFWLDQFLRIANDAMQVRAMLNCQ